MSRSKLGYGEEKTFKYEDSLPSLPVPPLKLTCQKYLQSVRPCVNDEQFSITKNKVDHFCQTVGPILQEKLERRAATTKNWLEKIWEEEAYMKPRYPIAPLINPAGPLLPSTTIWPDEYKSRNIRTAVLLHFLLQEWKLLYTQQYAVHRKGDTVFSMSQYRRWISWCRIPGNIIDSYIEAFKPAPAPAVNHVIVLVNGRIYKCVVLTEDHEPLSIAELEKQLDFIDNDAYSQGKGPGIGSLTSEYRPVWAEARDHLLSLDFNHSELINEIQTSILAICYDDNIPSSLDELCSLAIGGDCRNRWFDKSFQVIAFKNGVFAINFDHLAYDGIVEILITLSATDNATEYLKNLQYKNVSTDVCGKRTSIVHELNFRVDDHLMKVINSASKQFEMLCDGIAFKSITFNKYGKRLIMKFHLHPDTFIQMAVLLADYKLHKRVAPTYETASTRSFYHGRTETMRSLTMESQRWCKIMEDSKYKAAEKLQSLKIACHKHNELMKEAENGLGIDRHLLGLKVIAEESGIPLPDIYTDEAWTKSGGDGNYILSTSLVGYRLVYGHTAPMVEDGYGAYYSIQNDSIVMVVSSYKSSKITDVHRYSSSIEQSLLDMQHILIASSKL